jgi:hypothetical protein
LLFVILVWTTVLSALLALGLAIFPKTRRAPVWVSVLALLLGLLLVLGFVMVVLNIEDYPVGFALPFAILPALIGYIALLVGRRGGSAPPGKNIQLVAVEHNYAHQPRHT